jgi:O-antigen/teichoic acid export membrane protein
MAGPKKVAETRSTLFHARHLARQSTLLLGSGVFSYIGAFGLTILVTRNLGASGAGVWFVAFLVAELLASLGHLGTDWIILRHGSHYHGIGDEARLRETIWFALAVTAIALGILGALLFFAASLLSRQLFETQGVEGILRLAALAAALMGIKQTLLTGTQAFKNMRAFALVKNIVQPAARLLFVALALIITPTRLSGFVGLVAAEAFLTLCALVALGRLLPLRGARAPIERRSLMKFGLPVWGMRMIENVRHHLLPLLLGSLATLSASGVFVASRRVSAASNAINTAMNQVYSPTGSNLFLQDRHDELRALFKTFGKWSFSLGFPLFCLQVAFPKEILSLFGEDFSTASTALIVLSVSGLFNFATGPVATTLLLGGRSSLAFLDHVIALPVLVVLGAWLISAHGILGAAITSMVVSAINNGLRLAQVWTLFRLHPYRVDYWKPIAAGAGAVVVSKTVVMALGLGITPLAAAVSTVILGASYVGLFVLFRLSDEDRAAVDAIRRRIFGLVRKDSGAAEAQTVGPKT